MTRRTVSLSSICLRDAWDPVWPLRPGRFAELEERLPGWPLLVLDAKSRLIFAADYLALLRSRKTRRAEALVLDVAPGEALLLAGQLRRSLVGMNLFERLRWVGQLAGHMEPAEIQRRADPGFAVETALLEQLPALTAGGFRGALSEEKIGLRAARRLLAFSPSDRRCLLSLFSAAHFSESHQGIVLNLVEEIAFARHWTVSVMLRRIGLKELAAGRSPAQAVVEALQALRYPKTAALEKEWQKRVRSLKLPGNARLSHAPFFESGTMELQLRLSDWAELERMLAASKKDGAC
jgi:hypothetical protein